jgi:hypothetical protein
MMSFSNSVKIINQYFLSIQVVVLFAVVAVASAGYASSYVKRYDGYDHSHSSYGVHDDHHSHSPLVVSAAVAPYPYAYGNDYGHYGYAAAPVVANSWTPLYSGYNGYASDYNKDYYAYPKYKYEYGVKDAHTGDHKTQWEVRDGDVVKGEYTLDEADGTKRVVEYTADDKHGFNAVVKKIGHAYHPETYYQNDYNNNYANGYYNNYYGSQYQY